MEEQPITRTRRMTLIALLVLPLLFFLFLRLTPTRDPMLMQPVFHFYIVSYTSLVALVVTSYVLLGISTTGEPQALFVATGFAAIAGIFFIHGLSTPGVLFAGPNQAVGWSARLSLTAGALLLALALRRRPLPVVEWLAGHSGVLWAVLWVAYLTYATVILRFPRPFEVLSEYPFVSGLVAVLTAGLFGWAAWRSWQSYRRQRRRLYFALSLALPWLALAQVSQYVAELWALSWWLYHMLMLAAFIVTMAALVMDYEHIRDFRLVRYFVSLSIIAMMPLVALVSEVAVRLTGVESARWPLFGVLLVAQTVLLALMLLVVGRAQSIIDTRTAALQAEKQWRADFINLLVHDMRTPLSVVGLALDIVLSGKAGPLDPLHRPRLQRARASTRQMSELVGNLLDVERFEAGRLEIELECCQVSALLQESVEGVRELINDRNLTVQVRLPSPGPSVQADPALLARIMQNLLTNAVKFSPEGGTVRLVVAEAGGQVTIQVQDQGPGVPPEERAHIFERFQRGPGADRTAGAGLGLTFCKLAAEAHGGTIGVEDGPDGSGSSFVVRLPAAVPVAAD